MCRTVFLVCDMNPYMVKMILAAAALANHSPKHTCKSQHENGKSGLAM